MRNCSGFGLAFIVVRVVHVVTGASPVRFELCSLISEIDAVERCLSYLHGLGVSVVRPKPRRRRKASNPNHFLTAHDHRPQLPFSACYMPLLKQLLNLLGSFSMRWPESIS